MKGNKKVILTVIWFVLGAVLFACSTLEIIDPSWGGIGGGLLGVAIAQTVRYIRYHKDASYRENVDIRNQDERNKFLSNRAWVWAGYLYVLLCGIAVIVLKVAGYEELSLWAAYSVCIILILYWGSFLVLRKKY